MRRKAPRDSAEEGRAGGRWRAAKKRAGKEKKMQGGRQIVAKLTKKQLMKEFNKQTIKGNQACDGLMVSCEVGRGSVYVERGLLFVAE